MRCSCLFQPKTAAAGDAGRRATVRIRPSRTGMTTLLLVLAFTTLCAGCAPHRNRDHCTFFPPKPIIAAQVDLDYVYDADRAQQEHNLALLIDRVQGLGITTVWLQAFADPDGDGVARELYYPNRFLPMRADLFHKVAGSLRRAGVEVYAWLPLLALDPGPGHGDLLVHSFRDQGNEKPGSGLRLSPFHPLARKIIRGIYEDLAVGGPLDGILFHDDGTLSDFEDDSPAARKVYQQAGFPGSIGAIRSNPALYRRWSSFKTRYLVDFSLSLLDTVRRIRPGIRSARNLYALAVLQPQSEEWLAQSLPLFLQAYDYTVLLAMPYMEEAADPEQWLKRLARKGLARTLRPQSLVFELQTVDWRQRRKISSPEIVRQVRLLRQQGALSFAYYPDDFFHDHPNKVLLGLAFAGAAGTPAGGKEHHD